MSDELRDHRVVGEPDLVTLLDAGVDADGARRQCELLDAAGLGKERPGILGVEPHLDGMASGLVAVCCKRLSFGDPDLLLDEIEAGHSLGDRVLDLDAPVQLEEEEAVSVDDELDRAGAAIPDRPSERHRGLVQLRAELRAEARRRGLLEHFLVPPLHGAVALAEGDDGSMRIREELHLYVARALEVALAVQRPVAESARGLALGGGERLLELVGRADDAHPASAASGCRLDEQREADLLGRAVGQDGDAGLARDPLGCDLVAAEPKRLGRRSDPGQPRRLDRFREVGVLREEPVAGMDRVGSGRLRGADVLLRVEVAGDLDGRVRRAGVE